MRAPRDAREELAPQPFVAMGGVHEDVGFDVDVGRAFLDRGVRQQLLTTPIDGEPGVAAQVEAALSPLRGQVLDGRVGLAVLVDVARHQQLEDGADVVVCRSADPIGRDAHVASVTPGTGGLGSGGAPSSTARAARWPAASAVGTPPRKSAESAW